MIDNVIKLKRGNYEEIRIEFYDENDLPLTTFDGKTIAVAIKEMNDNSEDDSKALIKKNDAIVDNIAIIELTITDTLSLQTKRYKADIRIEIETGKFINSESFIVEVEDTVTKSI